MRSCSSGVKRSCPLRPRRAIRSSSVSYLSPRDEPLGVGLADLACALLLRHAGLVVGEGLALEPRRDATAPDPGLQAALRGLLTFGEQFADLGAAVLSQLLSRQQWDASRGCLRAESRRERSLCQPVRCVGYVHRDEACWGMLDTDGG